MPNQTATIVRESVLDLDCDDVWDALQQPATMRYVLRGLIGFPAMANRVEPITQGESGSGSIRLFHVVPFGRWTIVVERVDAATHTLTTREHGGAVRRWDHTLHVEPAGSGRTRYRDTIVIDAGHLTGVARPIVDGLFRYRHRRWRRLVRHRLSARTSSVGTA